MDLVVSLYFAVGVLLIFLITTLILYFTDRQAKQTEQNKALSKSTQQKLLSKSDVEIIDDMVAYGGRDNYYFLVRQAEISRRLIAGLKRFNNSSTLFSIALIVLALVQIVLAFKNC